METNPKEYDTRSTRMPQPNQFYEGRDFSPQGGWQRQPRPQQPVPSQNGVGQPQQRSQQPFLPQSGVRQPQSHSQPTPLAQSGVGQPPKKVPAKMPKGRVLAIANKLKKGLVIASIMGFGLFGGLATLHQVGTTATTTTNKTTTTSTQNSSSQNSANFLKQSGTSTATSTATPTNTATATTAPVTGSSTS